MAIEGYFQGSRGIHKKMKEEDTDKELKENREELNILMLQWHRMQQGEKES
jgi:hypothetical protein